MAPCLGTGLSLVFHRKICLPPPPAPSCCAIRLRQLWERKRRLDSTDWVSASTRRAPGTSDTSQDCLAGRSDTRLGLPHLPPGLCDTLCQNLLALNPLHLLLGQPLPSIPTHKMGSIKHTSLMRRVRAKMGHAWKASPHTQAPAAVAAITGMTEQGAFHLGLVEDRALKGRGRGRTWP